MMPDAVTYMGLEIYKADQFDYVDSNMIPESHRPLFNSWMNGQTAPMIEGMIGAVYRHDFERWYEKEFHNVPTYWD